MDTIAQCIIEDSLSVDQADIICADLNGLQKTGLWDGPKWAHELAEHWKLMNAAHASIQHEAWRAAAKAYQRFIASLPGPAT